MKIENPTSRDIADIAGVSQATVSRALRDSPLVRQETRERIQQIARDLNYFVNRNAAGLRTHQSRTIALLLFDETEGENAEINPFFLSMLGYITRCAAGLGFDVLVSLQQLHDDWHVEYQASNRADGLILLGYGDYVTYREKLAALADANTRFMIWGAADQGSARPFRRLRQHQRRLSGDASPDPHRTKTHCVSGRPVAAQSGTGGSL